MPTPETEKASAPSSSAASSRPTAAQANGAENAASRQEKASKTSAQADNEKAAVSALDLLKADHRKVEQLFSSYEQARRRQEKAKIAQNICQELIVHAQIEEEIFYPACRAHVEDAMLDEAQVEHDGAKVMIAELATGSPSDEFYDAKVKVLSEYIKHHVQEEEKRADSIFAQAEAGGLDMAEIGQQMQARKAELTREMAEELTLPQPLTLDVTIGEEEEETEETMASRDYGRGRYDEEDDRRGRRMPERDEYGRFMSDDESEGRGGGRGGSGRYASRGRDDDEGRYSSRGGGSDDRGQGGWFGDPEGHSEASRKGWEHREQEGRMSRGGDYDERRYSSRSRDDDDRRYGARGGRGGESRSGGYESRGDYSQDRGQGGWFGDSEGHAEAARKGWDEREREGQGRMSRGGGGYDERRSGYSSRGRGRDEDEGRYGSRGGSSDDRGQGGWFGDPEGHSEAARRGWEHRR